MQLNLTGSKISMSSTKFVFFGPIRKTRWLPLPLISWDIFNFSSETAERNSTKLDGKQDLITLYQVCVFRADRKNKIAALASDWLRHFRLLFQNSLTEFNGTIREARTQHPLPICIFRADRKNKMAALVDSSKRLHIVLRCTICGPLGLLFMDDVIIICVPRTRFTSYTFAWTFKLWSTCLSLRIDIAIKWRWKSPLLLYKMVSLY